MKKERRPIVIAHVGPALEDGRYPVKREVDHRRLVGEHSLTVTLDPQGKPAAIYRAQRPGGGQ